ncbi:LytTR family DNA-binding domain-containing protein [Clostridium sp. DJ247]|uniref:LytR/AlgR family response regulator transcription factor n=1 Tax=Clostridium sp. DJ247 TaxID=2726188 RepID=UPI00162A78DE|nr:LytTR family DNA-binding domain-containing protein [Clostridium sp. DJ247]MBC2581411.1 response regulator transcription factor [Clostridium sp. DJ247]
MMNILIVEDDEYQRRNLVKMIEDIDCTYNILEAANLKEARKLLKNNNIDLFYLDISLGTESGLDLASEIRKNPRYKFTWIIFITTHKKYMLEAFKEIHCYDYIIKPYDKEKVKEVTIALTENSISKIEDNSKRKSVIFDVEDLLIKLYTSEIIFVEVYIRTCYVHTKLGKYTVKNLSLKKLTKMINDEAFIQSHRAYIVNKQYIREIRKGTRSWEISFKGYDETALLGTRFKKAVLNNF